MSKLPLSRIATSAAAALLVTAALAQAPAPAAEAGGGSNPMVMILVVLLVLALVAIVVLLQKGKSGGSTSVPVSSRASEYEEEGTQVRVVGHRLVRMHGGVKVGSEYPVVNSISIGRDAACSMSLADSELSGQHAEVRVDGSGAFAIDKGSTNGTFVNGERLTPGVPQPLKDGDMIRMGTTEILYKSA